MANFASQEDTLLAGVAQTFNFKQKLGVNATSLVYSNDSASSTHTLAIDGFSFKVLPGEERVLSGVENWEVLTIGGDAGSTGAYRCYATSSVVPATIIKPQGGPITTSALADNAVTDAKLALGSHLPVTTSALGSPFPIEVLVIDVDNAADAGSAGIDYTGLVGKHELLTAYATFSAPAADTLLKVMTAGGSSVIAEIKSPGTTANTTVNAGTIVVANTVLASGATIRIHREKGAGSSAARLTLVFMKVA